MTYEEKISLIQSVLRGDLDYEAIDAIEEGVEEIDIDIAYVRVYENIINAYEDGALGEYGKLEKLMRLSRNKINLGYYLQGFGEE